MRHRASLLPLLVVLAAVVAHAPAVGHDFVYWDDNVQVFENPHVMRGLTWRGVAFAFTNTRVSSYWMPVTWLSHMIDVELYGLRPWGHHLTNILLHAANAGLLWLLLRRLTGATWRSAVVALLFATHPVHVESVAWVTERKDVLSLLFGLFSLLAYERYARSGRLRWYGLTAAGLAVGLMAKAMIVTLPCVMLLLDAWPLGRFAARPFSRRNARLVLEKAPLLAISLLFAGVTLVTQQPAMMSVEASSPAHRIANAAVAYMGYLGMFAWPVETSTFYPYVREWPAVQVVSSAALLLTITSIALWPRRERPYLLVGWLWFLGTLVPVIGIVQVGEQALAPRFVYLPFIGLYVAVAWGAWDVLQRVAPNRGRVHAGLVAGLVLLLTAGTWAQTRHWRNTETLFEHALRISPSGTAHLNLGAHAARNGDPDAAMRHYLAAVALAPHDALVHFNLAVRLADLGRVDEALERAQLAQRLRPGHPDPPTLIASLLMRLDRHEEARAALEHALRLDPRHPDALHAMGVWLAQQGRVAEALPFYERAMDLKPGDAAYLGSYGLALQRLDRLTEALAAFEASHRLAPTDPNAALNLAVALAQADRLEDALGYYGRALTLMPDWALAENNLGVALARLGRWPEALVHFERAAALGHPGAAANAERVRAELRERP